MLSSEGNKRTTISTLVKHVLVITTATPVVINGFNSTSLYVINISKFLLKIYCSLHTLPVNRKTEKD
jgi:hypothetical protein